MDPSISVVMAVRNGAATIEDQLAAIARQTLTEPWELIVVDNGSHDGTEELLETWRSRLPGLRVVNGPRQPSQAAALNAGVAAARSERIAICDADDVVGDGWLQAMRDALESHAHVTGPIDLTRLNPPEFVWGDHVESWLGAPLRHSFRPYAMGCNVGWQRKVIESLGGFDPAVSPGHDRKLSWLAQLAGHELCFEPRAIVHRRQRPTLRAAARQHFLAGRIERTLVAEFKHSGARSRSIPSSIRQWLALAVRLPWLLRRSRRLRWVEMAAIELGRLGPPLSRRRPPA